MAAKPAGRPPSSSSVPQSFPEELLMGVMLKSSRLKTSHHPLCQHNGRRASCSTGMRTIKNLHTGCAANKLHSHDIPDSVFSEDQRGLRAESSPSHLKSRKTFYNGSNCPRSATQYSVKCEGNLVGKQRYFLHEVAPCSLVFH